MAEQVPHLDPRALIPPKHIRQHTPQAKAALKASIERLGVLQPITVVPEGSRFRVVTGWGRVEVCKELGILVPARVLDGLDPVAELERTFAENEARCPMSPVEKAEFLITHMKLSGGTQEQAAEALGVKPPYASKLLAVKGKLSAELLEHVHACRLDIGSAYEIARLADHAKQAELAGLVMEGKLKRESVTNRVRAINGGKPRKEKPVKARTAKGLAFVLPQLALADIRAQLKAIDEAVAKMEKLGLPLSSLQSLLKS